MIEVTAYAVYKALRETESNGMTDKAIAVACGIDTTSENLLAIKQELLDSNHGYEIRDGVKFWNAI